ncbi:MAG: glycosyltransferase family 2 protein, partial [Pseudomonadota bacterium]|nr:glycosyltransferase family 2 protein [Pseudomonadota bacterium]
MDKISVIIPVYNTENFLEQCLGSVVNQTYKNLEILIVDDGSPDKSDAVYKRFALEDNRIKIIKQKNSGLSVARNTGLKFATGQWIHFIDSDDYLDLDYYEKMVNAARDINPDIIAGGVISQNSNLYNIQYKTKCV